MTEQKAELVLHQTHNPQAVSVFIDSQAFENAQRIAVMLSKSDIVPETYKGRVDNVMVALEMSNRMQVSPLMVMQNLDIIHGKPSFNSKFTAAMVNGCGKYSALRYKIDGQGDQRRCVAYTKELATGEILEGPPVTVAMAKSEGWWAKKGSKWPTMTDLMLTYRAATFWCRVYEPGLTMGIPTTDELHDIGGGATIVDAGGVESINERIRKRGDNEQSLRGEAVQPVQGDPVTQTGVSPADDEALL